MQDLPHIDRCRLNKLVLDDVHANRCLERVVRCFHRWNRPMFAGTVSVESGISVERALIFIDFLEEHGHVRKATDKELESIYGHPDSCAYALSVKQRLDLAYIE